MTTLLNNAPPVRVVVERRDPLVLLPTSNTGPSGAGGVSGVVLEFLAAAYTWTINHNLGRKVDVALFNTGSVKMSAEVILINDNQAVANFSTPTAGFARVI